ncbi:Hypothetical protein SCF082_LOCUS20947 [Durusdinium trenchii]|uniref:TLC domain-containing protein n=1 Tax=Durusdinium trenchii TaxID=1381693 RepID=A0ABP0L8R1_9DINO
MPRPPMVLPPWPPRATLADLALIPGLTQKAFSEYGHFIFSSCAVQMVLFFLCLQLVRVVKPDQKDKVSLADTVFSSVFFPVLAFAAVAASLELRHDVHSRWEGKCFWSELYLILYVSRMMCHIVMQPFEDMNLPLLIMMTIHHLISMGCYIMGLGFGRCHFWGCLDGCCEITTVFLNGLYFLNGTEVAGKKLKHVLPAWISALNGVLLWLAFLVFRLGLFPYWLLHFNQDLQEAPESTRSITTNLERSIYPYTTMILLFLSFTWFIPLTQGMVKSVMMVVAPAPASPKKLD